MFRLSDTPGQVKFTGRRKGTDTAEILASYGVARKEQDALHTRGIV